LLATLYNWIGAMTARASRPATCDFQLRLLQTVVAITKGVPDNAGEMTIHLGKASLGPLNVLSACSAPG
jgi:hypothetical protein